MSSWSVAGFISPTIGIGIARVLLLGILLGLPATALLTPFLLSNRFRSLFRAVGPTRTLAVNYLVWLWLFGGLQIGLFGTGIALLAVEIADPDQLQQLMRVATAGLAIGYPLCVFAGIRYVLGAFGIDWKPHGYDRKTIGVLVGAIVWYQAATVIVSPYAIDAISGAVQI
ncbi:hypothetical protein [Halocatena halophila]|uniref:hypothetical protein n=1 Tax=Halocatena halophila TaxID=2814576 RepID=UPI002ED101EF